MPANITPPIVAELGSARQEEIKQLRGGRGPLIDDVQEAMRHVRANADLAAANRVFVPVVVIYTQSEREDDDDD